MGEHDFLFQYFGSNNVCSCRYDFADRVVLLVVKGQVAGLNYSSSLWAGRSKLPLQEPAFDSL